MGRCFIHGQNHFAPHHQRRQAALGRLFRISLTHQSALTQDGNPIRHPQNLFQLVRDKDDRGALLPQPRHDGKETFDLLGRENSSRLVENQNVGVAVERLDNLYPLAHPDRQIFNHRIRIDIQIVTMGKLLNAGGDGAGVEKAIFDALAAQHNILGHRHHWHQLEVLMHHADAQGNGVIGVVHGRRLAIDQDFTTGWLVETVDDIHQGRFARAIFAQQRQNLAALEFQVDILIGDDAGKVFGDVADFQDRSCHISVLQFHTLSLPPLVAAPARQSPKRPQSSPHRATC